MGRVGDEERAQATAEAVARWMCREDRVARRLGVELLASGPGRCRLALTVDEDMLNAHGLTHGAVTYALADIAFAVASNSRGRSAVALATSMSYPAASGAGDRLLAEAVEESLGGRTAVYRVEVRRDDGTLVGLFSGTVYRRSDPVPVAEEP
ncbi:hydroxyphenylacetyl-CoA thioesterase PaaI [Inmirania thermothiophila]|uniref:hydroxyphenylacetyl-CoA thioesterase PaaI n=1 Tax=Inmirania thermothiophila TaxID=1750597 RepID=UPI0014747529|nr:hydroxyphenylacetyl-CoA thioesterase PaaI [Inmirania thermothiophila]